MVSCRSRFGVASARTATHCALSAIAARFNFLSLLLYFSASQLLLTPNFSFPFHLQPAVFKLLYRYMYSDDKVGCGRKVEKPPRSACAAAGRRVEQQPSARARYWLRGLWAHDRLGKSAAHESPRLGDHHISRTLALFGPGGASICVSFACGARFQFRKHAPGRARPPLIQHELSGSA